MPRRIQRQRVKRPCHFCENKTLPDYKNVGVLRKFTTERGKIMSRAKTGICAKHQRRMVKAIKWARHLALLPYILKI